MIEDIDAAIAGVDRVLLSSEPFIFRPPQVAEMRALYPGQRVDFIDGEMTSWYGNRAIEGLRYLRRLRGGSESERAAADYADKTRAHLIDPRGSAQIRVKILVSSDCPNSSVTARQKAAAD